MTNTLTYSKTLRQTHSIHADNNCHRIAQQHALNSPYVDILLAIVNMLVLMVLRMYFRDLLDFQTGSNRVARCSEASLGARTPKSSIDMWFLNPRKKTELAQTTRTRPQNPALSSHTMFLFLSLYAGESRVLGISRRIIKKALVSMHPMVRPTMSSIPSRPEKLRARTPSVKVETTR